MLNVFADRALITSIPIKGLINHPLRFQEYLDLICKEAVSMWRQTQRRTAKYRQVMM